MTRIEQAMVTAAQPCEDCDDSGYIERVSGASWTGRGMRHSLSVCHCICGHDLVRERLARDQHHKETNDE